jgi:hypothetical protein
MPPLTKSLAFIFVNVATILLALAVGTIICALTIGGDPELLRGHVPFLELFGNAWFWGFLLAFALGLKSAAVWLRGEDGARLLLVVYVAVWPLVYVAFHYWIEIRWEPPLPIIALPAIAVVAARWWSRARSHGRFA